MLFILNFLSKSLFLSTAKTVVTFKPIDLPHLGTQSKKFTDSINDWANPPDIPSCHGGLKFARESASVNFSMQIAMSTESTNHDFPQYLRLHVTEEMEAPSFSFLTYKPLAKSIERVTGWEVDFAETRKSFQNRNRAGRASHSYLAHGEYSIVDLSLDAGDVPVAQTSAEELVKNVNVVLEQLAQARTEIENLNAELATAVPVVKNTNNEERFRKLLDSLLWSAAEVVGCDKAALYMLTDDSTQLEARCGIGMDAEFLFAESRPLEECVGDLEALVGHAVVIENTAKQSYWKVPVECASAICIPVSSDSTVLGTLWIFGDTSRDYSAQETNMIEIIAGRIASELQLVSACNEIRMHRNAVQINTGKNDAAKNDMKADGQENATKKTRRTSFDGNDKPATGKSNSDDKQTFERRPAMCPPLDCFRVELDEAGKLDACTTDSNAVVDWSFNDQGKLCLLVAATDACSDASGRAAGSIQTAFAALRKYISEPEQMIKEIVKTVERTESSTILGEMEVCYFDVDSGEFESARLGQRLESISIANGSCNPEVDARFSELVAESTEGTGAIQCRQGILEPFGIESAGELGTLNFSAGHLSWSISPR